jgi:hypothetical protein
MTTTTVSMPLSAAAPSRIEPCRRGARLVEVSPDDPSEPPPLHAGANATAAPAIAPRRKNSRRFKSTSLHADQRTDLSAHNRSQRLECSMLIVVGIVLIAGLVGFLVMNRKKAKA